MKKITSFSIAVCFLLFFNTRVFCQGIYNRANIIISGNVFINVQNGGFRNDGHFMPGNSTVIISGNSATTISAVGGSNTTSFNSLVINKGNNEAELIGHITVDSNLIMQHGNLVLNLFNVDLGKGNGKIINENDHSHITGFTGGYIIKTAVLNNPVSENPGNIGLAITVPANLGNTVIRRSHQQQTSAGGGFGIYRYFDIAPSSKVNKNATLQLFYFDDELAGIEKNELNLYQRDQNENSWILKGEDKNDTSAKWVLKTNVRQFSAFTLASNIKNQLDITTGNQTLYTAFPNPSSGIFNVTITVPSACPCAIGLYDLNGKLLQEKQVQLQPGGNQLQWNISGLPKSIYFIKPCGAVLPAIKIIKE